MKCEGGRSLSLSRFPHSLSLLYRIIFIWFLSCKHCWMYSIKIVSLISNMIVKLNQCEGMSLRDAFDAVKGARPVVQVMVYDLVIWELCVYII
jgi:hypothetical protein